MKKKVTLSIDSKIYSDFQKFCEENAIMLSKKVELTMKEILKGKKKLIFMLLLPILLMNFMSAAAIFSDGFESGNLNSWTLTSDSLATNWSTSTTNPLQGTYHAQANPGSVNEPAATMEKLIDTTGYENIIFNYSRRLVGLDIADEFQVEWYNGASWQLLEQTGGSAANDAAYVNKTFSLPIEASDNSAFKIKFECTCSGTEYCRVDDINITGAVIDITPPQFSNFVESPVNNSQYSQSQNYFFNVTITDPNTDKVWINWNGINYTNGNITNSSATFVFNRSNLAAGIYNYTWWANDTNGNTNSSGTRIYVVAKAFSNTSLIFDKTSPQTYGTTINASCSLLNGIGTPSLYRNGIDVTSENNQNILLAGGTYTYSCNLSESENYTSSYNSSSFTIEKTSGNIILKLNNVENNASITYGQTINASASTSYGSITLHRNGIDITSDNNQNRILGAGYYNYTAVSSGDENHSSESVSYFLTINKATPSASLTSSLGWSTTYGTPNTIGYSESNSGDSDITYTIYRDGENIGSGETITLGVGGYSYTLSSNEGANYTSASLDSKTLTINKKNPSSSMNIVLTPSSEINYGVQSSATASESNSGDSDLVYKFYRNNSEIANPNTDTLNAGSYNYTYNTSGGQNYTEGQATAILTVNKITNNLNLLLNGNANNIEIEYGQAINASASSSSGTFNLYRNDSLITSENNQNILLNVGYYEYFVNSSGSQNYLENSSGLTYYLTVTEAPDTTGPLIDILHPTGLYTTNLSLPLNFSVNDISNISSCWYSLNNGERNTSISNCQNTTFDVLGEGTHTLTLYANDTLGNENFETSMFNVDLTGITLVISQPSGTKTSRTGIPLTYSVLGNNLTCWYDLNFLTGGLVIPETIISNCTNITFDLSADGNYVLGLHVNNTLGNAQYVNSTFYVDTSSSGPSEPGPSSGGGSSGGGGSFALPLTTKLETQSISRLVLDSTGVKKVLSWQVKNAGTKFLNDCTFASTGDLSDWIDHTETKDLSAGEEYSIIFDVNIPEKIETGEYTLSVEFVCKETNTSSSFVVEIISKTINFELTNAEKEDEETVKVDYSLEELSGKDQNIGVQFLIFDSEGKKVSETNETKFLSGGSREEFSTLISITKGLTGELKLLININSDTYSGFIEESIFLGSSITGYSLFDRLSGKGNLISLIIILLFLIFAFFIIRKTRIHHLRGTSRVNREELRKRKHK